MAKPKTPYYSRITKKLYDDKGEWVGVEIIETMTRAEAKKRYPQIEFIDFDLTEAADASK